MSGPTDWILHFIKKKHTFLWVFTGFVIYTFVVVVTVGVLIFYCEPHYGQKNPFVYVTVTGAIGSLTVMACKGLGVALKQTMGGDSQVTNWLSWLLLVTVAICISIQMIYLNKALDVFNTSIVTPILYVVFTSCVILASAILFKVCVYTLLLFLLRSCVHG